MKKTMIGLVSALLVSATASAQSFIIPERIEKLAEKARESVNITLDGPLLQLAGQFLNSGNSDERAVKELVSKLKGIHVRTFEFDREGEYSESDLEPIRAQLKAPSWARLIEAKEQGEHTQVFVKQDRNELGGLVILATERKGLSIVIIDGAIDLKRLSMLGGNFGIPNLNLSTPEPVKSGTAKDSAE
jgi:Domain of unknown function (DUF4252)